MGKLPGRAFPKKEETQICETNNWAPTKGLKVTNLFLKLGKNPPNGMPLMPQLMP